MIIHCTKRLAARLPEVSPEPLAETNPLGSWHANLYTIDRRNCILFCHDQTRFVLFMAGVKKEHFARLDFWFHDLFANTLLKQGCDTSLIEKTHPLLTPLRFDTSCDRSVQGSMRTARMMELESMLWCLPDGINLLPYNTSAQLNHRPVTVKGMKASECLWPDRDMKAWLETVTGAGLY